MPPAQPLQAARRTHVVIPAELLSRLQQLAGDHERTLSAEIRHAIRTYLRIIERQEQQQNR